MVTTGENPAGGSGFKWDRGFSVLLNEPVHGGLCKKEPRFWSVDQQVVEIRVQ